MGFPSNCGLTIAQIPGWLMTQLTHTLLPPLTYPRSPTQHSKTSNCLFPGLTGGPIVGEFKLAQFHFHWGSDNNCGSEHTLDGRCYPAEVGGSCNFVPVPAALGHGKFPVPGKDLPCPALLVVCSKGHFLSQSICLSVHLSNTIAFSMFLVA